MPGLQDVAQVSARYVAATGNTVGVLQPHATRRRVVLMAVTGPSNSTLKIFRGYSQTGAPINTVYPAAARTWDSTRDGSPMTVWGGEALTFVWSGGNAAVVGAVASATVTSEIDPI